MKVLLILSLVALVAGIHKREQKCYGNYGCFSNTATFKSIPEAPDAIKTQFLLFTRHSRSHATAIAALDEKHWDSLLKSGHFTASKPTKFIIHGFVNSGSTSWVKEMKDALLTKGDFNVLVVDWGHGSYPPYDQAAANTFLVAAQTARFIKHLQSASHVDLKNVHLIGHSLGAQISGNTGAAVRHIGRISGLDPAEPDFDNFKDSQRLDKTDADHVDVVHTDGEKFHIVTGFGMMKASGDIDFYPNGGKDQPGCSDKPLTGSLGSILTGHLGSATGKVSCSHGRAVRYYIESLKGESCKFTAHACKDWATYEAGSCHGCPSSGCPIMGFDADKTSARGSFYLSTVQKSPYCGFEYYVEVDLASVDEASYGRLYITFVGSKGTTPEEEFSRDMRHYHKGDKEKHLIALSKDIGTVSQVKLRFVKGGGFSALGTANEITISRVLVRNVANSSQQKFCIHEGHIEKDQTVALSSHSGC